MSCYSLLTLDLDHVLAATGGLWEELRGKRLFVTGGTGFFGVWLVETFLWANERLGLGASATVLSRDPEAFLRRMPHLAGRADLEWRRGDVQDFAFPEGPFSHVIHAATPSTGIRTPEDRRQVVETIVEGTRRTLDFARQCGTQKLLLVSSGAVYGRQPPELAHVAEEYAGGPDPMDPASGYGHAKRLAEHLGRLCADLHGIEVKVARPFALVGPGLPLDAHFAAGNFLRDALAGGPICVQGDGTPCRSYLYAADLAVWLWTILVRARSCRPYNVGSEVAVSIAELAGAVAGLLHPPCEVRIAAAAIESHGIAHDRLGCQEDKRAAAERYVPSCERARRELGLRQAVDLSEALQRTIRWHHSTGERSSHG